MKKTILYLVTQSDFGGAQRYIFDLAASLRDSFNIIVAAGESPAGTAETSELAQRLKSADIKFVPLQHVKRAINPYQDTLAIFELSKLFQETKPNIIHLNSSKISILGSLAAALYHSKIKNQKSKIIYTVHGWVFNEPAPAWKQTSFRLAEKLTARWKDKLICVSEKDYQIACRRRLCPYSKLTVIHNGLAEPAFWERSLARQKLTEKCPEFGQPIQPDTLLIGAIGNLYPTKGFEFLIEALAILKKGQPDLKTIIIGEGEAREKLEALIEKTGLAADICLAGTIPDASRLLKAFDIFVSSSVKEGLPYNIIEAMTAERAIVATRVGGVPELIIDGQTGLLAESRDAKDLADKINLLLADEGKRQAVSRNAAKKARAEFTLDTMVSQTERVYYENLKCDLDDC